MPRVGVPHYNLGSAAGIPLGEGRVFHLGSTDVAVFRTRSGEVFSTQACCPHKQGPLADGIVGAGRVICPLHACSFELATGRSSGENCAALTVYPVTLSADGELHLNFDE
jgi:nitrite reductase (NADH) small subunit